MKQLWAPWRMPYLKNDFPAGGHECIFCRKVHCEDDAKEHVLFRGQHCFITLNLYPYNNGHMMVVPYRHIGKLEELDEPTVSEMMRLTQRALRVLNAAYAPDGFNIGINQGEAAGAGIAAHLHQHIVPRWRGDTNYMTVIAETRTIPEWIDQTYERLKALWAEMFPEGKGEKEPHESET
ncbi:MAG TPA: HIT domain-containing protein [Chloroflexi bacterium]|nr:HIT domain-containing protein [Chloroflexota bacterium]